MKNEKRELDCNTWFEKDRNGNLHFVPYECAQDYCVNSEYWIITAYKNKYPSAIVDDDLWIDDVTNLIRSKLEMAGKGKITHENMDSAIESIENLTRITDPKMINLTVKEYYDKVWRTPVDTRPSPEELKKGYADLWKDMGPEYCRAIGISPEDWA